MSETEKPKVNSDENADNVEDIEYSEDIVEEKAQPESSSSRVDESDETSETGKNDENDVFSDELSERDTSNDESESLAEKGDIDEVDLEIPEEANTEKLSSTFKVWLVTRLVKLRKANKKKLFGILALLIAVVVFAVLVFTDIIPILPNSYHRSYVGNQYKLGETQGSVFQSCGENVIYADNNRIICFGPDMSVKKEIEIFFDSPLIRVNDAGAIVYSPGERQAVVMMEKSGHRVVETEERIKKASVNSKGGYVIVAERAGFESLISAYGKSGNLLYERNTNKDVVDAVLSDDSKVLAVSNIEMSDDAVHSSLILLDTTRQESVISEIVHEDNLIVELYYHNSRFIAVGDRYTVCYNMSGKEMWRISYPDKECKSFDISEDGNLAFVFNRFNSEQSESYVEIYEFNGKKTGEYHSDKNIRSISVNNGYCLLSAPKSTILIDSDGKHCKTKQIPFDFEKVILYDNYNFGFVVNDRVCEVLSVNN